MSIVLKSPAKINLTLDILGKDQKSGKHFVNTILYRDDLFFDELELSPIPEKKNILKCSDLSIPNEQNLVLRALDLLGITGWEISLWKKIPPGSGLGGGSSNAACILKFFQKRNNIPEPVIQEAAKKLGADVPFFLLDDNLAYFEGFGDQLQTSWNIPPLSVEYLNTGISILTREAYEKIDLEKCGKDSGKTEALLKNIDRITESDHLFHNDFEYNFFKNLPNWSGKGHLCGSGGWMWREL